MENLSTDDVNLAVIQALRHYVTFSYYARSPKIRGRRKNMAQVRVCSAFLLRIGDIRCLVTAGQVLDKIDADRQAGIDLVNFRLWDGWSMATAHKTYLPFDFFEVPRFRLKESGLDYGLMPMRHLHVKTLEANGAAAIASEHYEKAWPSDFHGYAMIGPPAGIVDLARAGSRSVLFREATCILPLAYEPNPSADLVGPIPRFYARILASESSPEWLATSGDITAMSGGPVIGIRREPSGVGHWLIGVQSGWLSSQRMIAASYFPDFVRRVRAKIGQSESLLAKLKR